MGGQRSVISDQGSAFSYQRKASGHQWSAISFERSAIGARKSVLVSFARYPLPRVQSFPRRRESTPQAIGNTPPTDWIPVFAGMTGVSKGIRFQITPLPIFSPSGLFPLCYHIKGE